MGTLIIEENQRIEVRALLTFCRLKIVVFKILYEIFGQRSIAQEAKDPSEVENSGLLFEQFANIYVSLRQVN